MATAIPRGAPKGNKNYSKNRPWADAIHKALAQRKDLDKLAGVLIDKALSGDMMALKEIGDRTDGKPSQQIAGTGEEGEHVFLVGWQKE